MPFFALLSGPYAALIKLGLFLALVAGAAGYCYKQGYDAAMDKQAVIHAKQLAAIMDERDKQALIDRDKKEEAEKSRDKAIEESAKANAALAKIARANPSLRALKIDQPTIEAIEKARKAGLK